MSEKTRRKLKNYLIDPGFQLKIFFFFSAAALSVTGVVASLLFMKVEDLKNSVGRDLMTPKAIVDGMAGLQQEMAVTLLATVILFMVIIFVYSTVISHRISGPVIAICKFIDDLIQGDYETKRNLRDYDDLKPVMKKLHELRDKLKKS